MTKNLFNYVTNHPILFLIASLIFALPFVAFSPFVKTVNNVDYFTLKDDPEVESYNEIKDIFGNDEFFVIAFEKKDIFTKKNLSVPLCLPCLPRREERPYRGEMQYLFHWGVLGGEFQ